MTALVVAGASIFLLLGIAHGALTITSKPTHGAFAATNPEVQAAMQAPSGLGMAPNLETTLWKAWIGFNLSHALGVIIVAAAIMFPALDDLEAATSRPPYVVLTLGVPVIYLALPIRFWFDRPTRGIALGAILTAAGTLGSLFG